MTFKNIFLSALLVPFAIMGNTNDDDVRIQQLRDDLVKKELELSIINEKIVAKEQGIHSLAIIISETYRSIVRNLNDKEKAEFDEELNSMEENLKNSLEFKFNIQNLPLKSFINESTDLTSKCDKIDVLIILQHVETFLLKKLFISFEQILQDLSDIGCELRELEKKVVKFLV